MDGFSLSSIRDTHDCLNNFYQKADYSARSFLLLSSPLLHRLWAHGDGQSKVHDGLPLSRSQSSRCLSELTLTCIDRGIESGDRIDHIKKQ